MNKGKILTFWCFTLVLDIDYILGTGGFVNAYSVGFHTWWWWCLSLWSVPKLFMHTMLVVKNSGYNNKWCGKCSENLLFKFRLKSSFSPFSNAAQSQFITTGLLKKFNLLILCCVHSPMLRLVLEICSFQYTAVQAHTLEARDLCYGVQFHLLSLLRSVIIETQFWIWCHYYDYRWSLVWSVQNMLAKCSLQSYSTFISIATSIPITKRKKTYTELWCL